MVRLRDQQGATLILIIGVVAALAILAAAMVTLTANVQHNTATHRTQSKAFNVAEAGLDAGQAALWVNWPDQEDKDAGTLPNVDPGTFRGQFVTAEFPDPTTGELIEVEFWDDNGDTVNPGIAEGNAKHDYDANLNDRMWIISRGATGTRAAKVQALVTKVTFDMLIKEGVALYTDGVLTTRGTGDAPVVGLDWPAVAASIYTDEDSPVAPNGWDGNGQADFEGGILLNRDAGTGMNDVFPDDTLTFLIDAAEGAGKYYDTQADIPSDAWSTEPRIIVVDHGGIDTKDVPDTDVDAGGNPTVWSEDNPGILIVLEGDLKSIGQTKAIYGIVYLIGGALLEGNAQIHGMCVAKEDVTLKGTRSVGYNYSILANLNRPRVLSVKLVPNTWREIRP